MWKIYNRSNRTQPKCCDMASASVGHGQDFCGHRQMGHLPFSKFVGTGSRHIGYLHYLEISRHRQIFSQMLYGIPYILGIYAGASAKGHLPFCKSLGTGTRKPGFWYLQCHGEMGLRQVEQGFSSFFYLQNCWHI